MRIAKPILLTSTPVGVLWGMVEAYRFHPWLAGLMGCLLSIISGFIWLTVSKIRKEQRGIDERDRANSNIPRAG